MKVRFTFYVSLFLAFLLLPGLPALAQSSGNARQRTIVVSSDSLVMDTLSLVPGSVTFLNPEGSAADTAGFRVDPATATVYFPKSAYGDTLTVVYRVFPVLLTQTFRKRDRTVIEKGFSGEYNPFTYPGGTSGGSLLKMEGLNKSGNISRGITFGNNQDLVVNSSFNLQLAGKLGDDVEILAAITDNNIPVQPEGNTQQIQDFDKVFIQLTRNKSRLVVGDFELRRPESYFMNFFKKGQGASFTTEYPAGNKKQVMRTGVSGAISKGRYARNVIQGVEANQGPYRLTGSENETFIIVLAGTEKVFIDGMEMTRGEQSDYIIDYNTAEVTFTTKRPITKDSRIVVEFQYSDKNFSRTLYFLNQEYQDDKLKIRGSFFSEQDAKNQPLLQDLNNEQKELLASVGDSLQNAVYPNVDSVAFNSNEVLYARIDSAGYSFYRYSTDSTVAFYRLGFSYLGPGRGNYVPVPASANGRVFQWVVPVNGIPQGSYEPVVQLISPKKQQMFTAGGDYKPDERTRIFGEFAYSNYNQNLFSDKDKDDDKGIAVNAGAERRFRMQSDSLKGWSLVTSVMLEHVSRRFKQLETFRTVEFNRDWNLGNAKLTGDENAASAGVSFEKPGQNIYYRFRTFNKGSDYRGYMNMAGANVRFEKFRLAADGSYLITADNFSKSDFIRSKADLSRPLSFLVAGAAFEQEYNKQYNPSSDSLLANSYAYYRPSIYVTSNDTAKTRFRIDGSRRTDYSYLLNALEHSSTSDEITGRVEFTGNPKSRLTLQSTYRNLMVENQAITSARDEETFLNRAEYNFTALNGMLVSSTFYEAGTGQEPRQDYAYVEVAPGTGVYTYGGDYNGNGVKDLDEFEVAAFTDQANYIKVFIPTNEYIKTRTNQFSQVLTISPGAYYRKKEGGGTPLIARFSDQFSYRIDNKTTEDDLIKALNPFSSGIDDSLLLTTSSALRNTFYFNRSSTIAGADLTWQDTRSKSLLTNGFESRVTKSLLLNTRWNISKVYGLTLAGEQGTRISTSEFFATRDYRIEYNRAEPRFSIQPTTSFRMTFSYEYLEKENVLPEGGELSVQHEGGVDFKFSSVRKGVMNVRFNIIRLSYNADENTPIAYEMLEGLKPGTNFTWGASLQRNLSNAIQVSLNYEGRKPQGISPIHTGTVSARAFF